MRRVLYVGMIALMSSCAVKVPPGQVKKSTAPGQVKKTTGSQSAAPYAPGQQKKSGKPASAGKKKL